MSEVSRRCEILYCTMNKKDQRHVKGVETSDMDFNALNTIYVEGVKKTYKHIFAHNFLNIYLTDFQSQKSFGNLRLRAIC